MSNNDLDNDDFENDGFEGFDDTEESSGSLGELIQSNPMVKVGIILGAAAIIFGVIILFGGKRERVTPSAMVSAPEMTVAPGTEDASLAYIEAIQDVNQQNLESAMQGQGSAIPIPIEPPGARLEITPPPTDSEDPLQRWRRLQEERLQREMERREVIEPAAPQNDANRQNAINALAQAMSLQMQSVLERQGLYILDQRVVTNPDIYKIDDEGAGGQQPGAGVDDPLEEIIIVPAGQILYAQLITEANSDVPGPVLAQIVSGPVAGSRILGTFAVQEELLTLQFNTIVIDGKSYPMQGVALDPNTTLPGMATDIDRRYFRRIILPTAAAFIEGAASVFGETGRTTVSVSGDVVAEETTASKLRDQIAGGVEEAGSQLRTILDEMNSNVQTLVKIRAGTPMGVLFVAPLTRPATAEDF
ncbi:MAG: TrbI/VirB10 family protein [Alphaproteobacteria bacterium]